MASLQRLTVRNQGHILGGAIGGVRVNMLLSMRITISSATRRALPEVYTLPFDDFYVPSGQPGSIGSTAIQWSHPIYGYKFLRPHQ